MGLKSVGEFQIQKGRFIDVSFVIFLLCRICNILEILKDFWYMQLNMPLNNVGINNENLQASSELKIGVWAAFGKISKNIDILGHFDKKII